MSHTYAICNKLRNSDNDFSMAQNWPKMSIILSILIVNAIRFGTDDQLLCCHAFSPSWINREEKKLISKNQKSGCQAMAGHGPSPNRQSSFNDVDFLPATWSSLCYHRQWEKKPAQTRIKMLKIKTKREKKRLIAYYEISHLIKFDQRFYNWIFVFVVFRFASSLSRIRCRHFFPTLLLLILHILLFGSFCDDKRHAF